MTSAERVLAHFDRISEAPDAVPRLRRFILDLAVRGRLVEQREGEEPEIARSTTGTAHRAACSVPGSWALGRVADLADCRLGKMLDKAKNRGIPRRYLRNVNVRWFDFDLSDVLEMPFEDSELEEFGLRQGDVLICEGGEPGRAGVWDEREANVYFQKAIHRVRFSKAVDPYFFVDVLRVGADDGTLAGYFTGVGIKHFTGKGLASFTFPIPPIAEQHRIVAKADELMALCDRLEVAQKEREHRRDRVVTASLARLNQSDDAPAFHEHACFHLQHLHTLATRREHVQQLRQTILSLAVRGKLVRQDPNDESTSQWLERSRRGRRVTVSEGDKRNRKDFAGTDANAEWADLPVSWEWATTETICEAIVDCPHSTPTFVVAGVVCLDTNCFKDGALIPHKVRYVSDETYKERTRRLVPRAGDVIFAREGSVGASVIVPEGMTCCLGQRVMLFRLMPGVLPRYFSLSLSETSSLARLLSLHKGIGAKHVNVADMRRAIVPLPPSAEQQRIVTKVDELMTVCEQLETQLEVTETESRRFLESVLHEALAPAV